MAVQAGFVAGTLITAMTNIADADQRAAAVRRSAVSPAPRATLHIAVAPTAAAIIALRFCTGAALAWVYPPGMKIAAGWFLERRGTALGIVVGARRPSGPRCRTCSPGWARGCRGAPGRRRLVSARAGRRAHRRVRRRRRPVRQRIRTVRSATRSAIVVAQPRRAAGHARLLRTHVGALRDVDVDCRVCGRVAGRRAGDRRLADRVRHDRQRRDRLRGRRASGPIAGERPQIAGAAMLASAACALLSPLFFRRAARRAPHRSPSSGASPSSPTRRSSRRS